MTLIILCRGARVLKNELKRAESNFFWMSSSFNDFKSAVNFYFITVVHGLKNLIVLRRGARVLKNELKRAESKYILDVVFFQ